MQCARRGVCAQLDVLYTKAGCVACLLACSGLDADADILPCKWRWARTFCVTAKVDSAALGATRLRCTRKWCSKVRAAEGLRAACIKFPRKRVPPGVRGQPYNGCRNRLPFSGGPACPPCHAARLTWRAPLLSCARSTWAALSMSLFQTTPVVADWGQLCRAFGRRGLSWVGLNKRRAAPGCPTGSAWA